MFVQVIQFKLFSQNNIDVCNNKFIRPRLHGMSIYAKGKLHSWAEASGKVFLCWLNFFKFNIAVRLNNLFDGRCASKYFWLNVSLMSL